MSQGITVAANPERGIGNDPESTAKVSGEGFTVKNICCVLLPASLWRRYALCYRQLHGEDMRCVSASLMKKTCCVFLPASLRRR